MNKDIEDFMDIRYSTLCPNCKKELFKFIWNKQNILSFSKRFEAFDVDGFNFYRNAHYKCPNCDNKFYTRIRANDSIFKTNE